MTRFSSARTAGHRLTRSAEYGTTRARRPAFYLVTIAFLALLLVVMRESMAMVGTAWLSGYAFPAHRVHHMMIGGTLTVFAAVISVQLYRPERRVGALQAAIAFVTAALVLTAVASGLSAAAELLIFAIPVYLIALSHPARRHLVPRVERLNARLLALGGIGAAGFAVLAVGEYVSHTTLANEHVVFGHYEFLLFALASIGLFALLAAFRPVGWRALVYGAGALATLFAVGSLAFPGLEQGSSLSAIAAVAVVAWAVAFVVVAEYVDRTDPVDDEKEWVAPA